LESGKGAFAIPNCLRSGFGILQTHKTSTLLTAIYAFQNHKIGSVAASTKGRERLVLRTSKTSHTFSSVPKCTALFATYDPIFGHSETTICRLQSLSSSLLLSFVVLRERTFLASTSTKSILPQPKLKQANSSIANLGTALQIHR
jgi:hypothetical protein